MRSRVQHDENKLLVVLLPNKKPIRLYVAFPLTFSVTMKNMWKIAVRQFAFDGKNTYSFSKQIHVIASPFAQLHLMFELASKSNCVHN